MKHAQCFDVALMRDGSIVLASKDYRLYIYRYVKVMELTLGNSLALCGFEREFVIPGPRHLYVKEESQFHKLLQCRRVVLECSQGSVLSSQVWNLSIFD